jgi:hypothetical protein
MPDIIDILPEYLDLKDLAEGELEEIAKGALATHIKALKVGIGSVIITAQTHQMMDNLEASSKALGEARRLKKQLRDFVAEYNRLIAATEVSSESATAGASGSNGASGPDGPDSPGSASGEQGEAPE